MHENDELVDIVNEHDEVIGTRWRSQAQGIKYKRCIMAFVRSPDYQFCLFKRAAGKKFDFSQFALVGGKVQSGEDYVAALKREVKEELNLDIDHAMVHALGLVKPWEISDANLAYNEYIKMIYEIIIPVERKIVLNAQDFSAYYWITPEELFSDQWRNENINSQIRPLFQRFYGNLINEFLYDTK